MGDVITLKNFLENFEDELTQKIKTKLCPTYDPASQDDRDQEIKANIQKIINPGISLYPAQGHLITAGIKHLTTERTVLVSSEMGTGKTLMSIVMAASDPIPRRHIVVCPPHLVQKWVSEVKKVVRPEVATAFNFNGKAAVQKLQRLSKKKPTVHEFYVMGRERAKGGYMWKHIDLPFKREGQYKIYYCPRCGKVVDLDQWRKTRKNYCSNEECKEALWEADKAGLRRYAPAEYIKRHIPRGFFYNGIFDEIHELKGESAQGVAFGMIASRCKRVVGLTGTLLGGYADDIFYILWRSLSRKMQANNETHSNKQGWIERYGVLEKVYKTDDRDNAYTRSMQLKSVKRRPGISPVVLSKFLIPNTLFMKLSDISDALPPYDEFVHEIDMDEEVNQRYTAYEETLEVEMREALRNGDTTVLSRMLQSLLSWPDGCRNDDEVCNREGEAVAYINGIDIDVTAKERKLIELVTENLEKGRKSLIFCEFTGSRDIMPTVAQKLEDAGIRPLVMRSTVQAEKREAWIKEQMAEHDDDVLICNPKLVQTGLDLLDFPEVIFYQTGYSIFVLRQAARRSWRIGQPYPVRVHYLCNKGTMQERAMTLIAKKLETALAIEGDLSESGLVALSDGGGVGSIVLELAKSLVKGSKLQGVEAAWSSYRKKEFTADDYIGSTTTETVTLESDTRPNVIRITRKKQFIEKKFEKFVQLSLFG